LDIVIRQEFPVPPEGFDILEEVPFPRRHGDRDATLIQNPITLALVPVMMGVKDRFYLFDPNLRKGVQYCPTSEIDQDRPITIAQNVNVTGIGEEK
jgi:hypothetical protein